MANFGNDVADEHVRWNAGATWQRAGPQIPAILTLVKVHPPCWAFAKVSERLQKLRADAIGEVDPLRLTNLLAEINKIIADTIAQATGWTNAAAALHQRKSV
jgi:hypothetical protein